MGSKNSEDRKILDPINRDVPGIKDTTTVMGDMTVNNYVIKDNGQIGTIGTEAFVKDQVLKLLKS